MLPSQLDSNRASRPGKTASRREVCVLRTTTTTQGSSSDSDGGNDDDGDAVDKFVSLAELETAIADAASREDYALAAKLRDRARDLQDEESVAVLQANDIFYQAFSECNMRKMGAIWADSEDISCVHPKAAFIVGRSMVMASWEAIFDSGQTLRISLDDVRVQVNDTISIVTCTESVSMSNSIFNSPGRIVATNIFKKVDSEWRMILHHASPKP